MPFKRFLPLAFAAGMAITPTLTAAPALADSYGTDAAVGAAVSAIVNSLLFDAHRDQYYYYEGPRPIYVSDGYARRWFQHRDPDYWRMHRREFRDSRADFTHEWEHRHHHNDREDRDWHHGDREDRDQHHGDREDRNRHHGEDQGWHHGDREGDR
jgi:hypothetical protein